MGTTVVPYFKDDGVRGQVDAPGQRGRGYQYLNVLVTKQILHKCSIRANHSFK